MLFLCWTEESTQGYPLASPPYKSVTAEQERETSGRRVLALEVIAVPDAAVETVSEPHSLPRGRHDGNVRETVRGIRLPEEFAEKIPLLRQSKP